MDEGVDAAGRRDARRCARQQLRVQNSAGRQQLIAEYGQLVVAPVVGDDRERRDLRAGACRGRDGDERHDLARDLVRALIFLDPAAVFCDDTDRLGDIHRRAAAEGHDKVRARRLVGRRRLSTVSVDGLPSVSVKASTAKPAAFSESETLPTRPIFVRCGPEMINACEPPSCLAASGSFASEPRPTMIFCGTEKVKSFMINTPL